MNFEDILLPALAVIAIAALVFKMKQEKKNIPEAPTTEWQRRPDPDPRVEEMLREQEELEKLKDLR
jgi:hypothetical protein